MNDTKQKVFASMDNEAANGRPFFGRTELEIADDILRRDSSLDYTVAEILPFVKEWCVMPMVKHIDQLVSEGDVGRAIDYLDMWIPSAQKSILALVKPETAAAIDAQ